MKFLIYFSSGAFLAACLLFLIWAYQSENGELEYTCSSEQVTVSSLAELSEKMRKLADKYRYRHLYFRIQPRFEYDSPIEERINPWYLTIFYEKDALWTTIKEPIPPELDLFLRGKLGATHGHMSIHFCQFPSSKSEKKLPFSTNQ